MKSQMTYLYLTVEIVRDEDGNEIYHKVARKRVRLMRPQS
jgi:hypothetical protein